MNQFLLISFCRSALPAGEQGVQRGQLPEANHHGQLGLRGLQGGRPAAEAGDPVAGGKRGGGPFADLLHRRELAVVQGNFSKKDIFKIK